MLALFFALILSTHAYAGNWQAQSETIWDVHGRKFISLNELTAQPGDIFVMGEVHAMKGSENDPETNIHHDNQRRLIQRLQSQGTVSVGMEFLVYTFQNLVDQFLVGILPEADFLKQVGWSGGNPFAFYRDQVLAPAAAGGRTLALNIPATIASHVASGGRESLTADELSLTPPFWERGNAAYFERFAETMKEHAPPDSIERYFWAQSLWDDTMAWKTLEHQAQAPNDIMVIIVGEFHVQFGGGLPYELLKNGARQVKTVLQVEADDWSTSTLDALIQPDPKYGPAADYLWLHTGVKARGI